MSIQTPTNPIPRSKALKSNLRLDIAVQNLPVVHVFERQADLNCPVDNLKYEKAAPLSLDAAFKVPSVSKVHGDVYVGLRALRLELVEV
eukprot:1356287-Amorphochlora_amoeboformis.AAC.1